MSPDLMSIHVGDRILEINGVPVQNQPLGEVGCGCLLFVPQFYGLKLGLGFYHREYLCKFYSLFFLKKRNNTIKSALLKLLLAC